MIVRPFLVLTLVTVLGWTVPGQAETIYKWTDSEGNVHYGDRPPAGDQTGVETKDVDADTNVMDSESTTPPAAEAENGEKAAEGVAGGKEGSTGGESGGAAASSAAGGAAGGGGGGGGGGGASGEGGEGGGHAEPEAPVAEGTGEEPTSEGTAAAESSEGTAESSGGTAEASSVRSGSTGETTAPARAPSEAESSPPSGPAKPSSSASEPVVIDVPDDSDDTEMPEAAPAPVEDEPIAEEPAGEPQPAPPEEAPPPAPDSPPPSAVDLESDFFKRCGGLGVIKCFGFNTETELDGRVFPDNLGDYPTVDTTIKRSGDGSLHMILQPKSGENTSGSWRLNLKKDTTAKITSGQTIYIQFRQRFDDAMLNEDFSGDGWKQWIMWHGKASCATYQIVTHNGGFVNFPTVYTACGGTSTVVKLPDGNNLLQSAEDPDNGYQCFRRSVKRGDKSGCGTYAPNQWMTFYYEIKVGDWGIPNSVIKAWMAYEGQPLKQFVHRTDYVFNFNSLPTDAFEYFSLTSYITNKTLTQDHKPAHTWYDELIFSTSPIPAPVY